MVTDAKPSGLRSRVPAKITSSILAPRRLLADCSPNTQLMASLRLDFPQPLGPTIAAIPEPANFISVRSKNDLKPCISTRLSFSKISVPFHYRLGGWVYGNRLPGESKASNYLDLEGKYGTVQQVVVCIQYWVGWAPSPAPDRWSGFVTRQSGR